MAEKRLPQRRKFNWALETPADVGVPRTSGTEEVESRGELGKKHGGT